MIRTIRTHFHHHILSFKYAFEGIAAAIKEEPHLRFHLTFALLVIVAGLYLQITTLDWIRTSRNNLFGEGESNQSKPAGNL